MKNPLILVAGLLLLLTPSAALADMTKEERRAARRAAAERQARAKQAAFWVASLSKPRVQDRFEAIWNLEALAPESVDPLVGLLAGRKVKHEVLRAATEALGEIKDPKARWVLEQAAVDPALPLPNRLTALIAIARLLDAPSRDFLRAFAGGKLPVATLQPIPPGAKRKKRRVKRRQKRARLAGVDPLLRRVALIALGMVGDAGLRPAAEASLGLTRDAETRRAAYRAMGYLKDRRLIELFVEGLKDPNPLVRGQAANALGKTGGVATADAIERNLKTMAPSGERFLLVDALAWVGRQSAIDELIMIAETKNSPLQSVAATVLLEIRARTALPAFRRVLDEHLRKGNHLPGVGQVMVYTLGDLGDKQSTPLLMRALTKGSAPTQREAATALGKLRVQKATPALLKIVRKGRLFSRVGALVALGRIGDKRNAAVLTKSLQDRDAPVRWAAAVALERLGEARVVPALTRLLKDPHPFVAAQAQTAIAVLKGKTGTRKRAAEQSDVQLSRLRALEREFLLRYRVGAAGPHFGIAAEKVEVVPPARGKNNVAKGSGVQRRMVYPNESAVLKWESVISTCGGTHPPIEYRIPVEVKVGEEVGEPRWEENPNWGAWRAREAEINAEFQAEMSRRTAARDRAQKARDDARAASDQAFLDEERMRAERIYRLKTIRAELEAELAEADSAAAGGKRRP